MKKFMKIVAAACMSLTLVACGANTGAVVDEAVEEVVDKNEAAAKEVVNSFFKALQEGDLEALKGYAAEDIISDLNKVTESFGELETMLDENGASDETKEKFTSIIPLIFTAAFEKQDIADIEKVSDSEYVFTVKNTGVSPDSLSNVGDAFDVEGFVNDNLGELQEKVMSDGQDAAMAWFMDLLADYMLENLNTYFGNQERKETELHFTVENTDGSWMITKMQEQ